MRTWARKDAEGFLLYEVNEVAFDKDLHEFMVMRENGEHIATITPADLDNQAQIIEDLDNGEGVDSWEDGMGDTISI